MRDRHAAHTALVTRRTACSDRRRRRYRVVSSNNLLFLFSGFCIVRLCASTPCPATFILHDGSSLLQPVLRPLNLAVQIHQSRLPLR